MRQRAQNNDAITHLLAKLAQASRERERLRNSIERLKQKDHNLRVMQLALQNQINEIKIEKALVPPASKSAPSVRSADQMRAWAALYEALQKQDSGQAIHQSECTEIIERAIPNCPKSTIRSYFRRFRLNGLIQKAGSGWKLANPRDDVAIPERSARGATP